MQATPLLDALRVEGNLPPWMWNDTPPNSGSFRTTPSTTGSNSGPMSTTTSGGGGAQGSAPAFGFPLASGPGEGIHPEDIDIDMSEDFNWADWGQTVMESGPNIGGVWSAHGI
ncbi:hypothetical protein M406DRAFT_356478 [Cryphonectria parasitica EP155]|uniref:Uncharacterized protein n=1 Tax=Cryphonectria parasitica (strain ATCC 38755 / EP155) TaxID=660469 RepID=A0A9P4Y064_CRYP1|nr:uncharacterized protein M406DRAFT_356478 [Cryphonectria parasitica EP155]KAF3764248.1 hypothetical protein M406DRAFT_356478 [Cryphonectria parasitica EP155]